MRDITSGRYVFLGAERIMMNKALNIHRLLDVKIGEACYVLTLGIWIFFSILSYTSMFAITFQGMPIRVIRLFCLSLLLLCELVGGKHGVASILFLFFVFSADLLLTEQLNSAVMEGLLFIYCGRNYSFRKAALTSFVSITMALVIVIGASSLGIIRDYVDISAMRTRHYLGFLYSLHPSMYIFTLTCLWIYIREDDLQIVEFVIWTALNYLVYKATVSRLSFALALLIIFVALFVRLTKGKFILNGPVGLLCVSSFIIAAVFSVVVTKLYTPADPLFAKLNGSSLLSGRLSLGQNALDTYGITAFGQSIEFIGNGLRADGSLTVGRYNYIDCLYILILVRYGWVYLIGFLALMTIAARHAWQTRDPYLLVILAVAALHCVIDDLMFYLYFNPFLLLAGIALCTRDHCYKTEVKQSFDVSESL